MTSSLERRQGAGILVGCWNGNGAFWSLLGMIYNALGLSNILFITETHASPICSLLDIVGYH